MLFLYNYVLYSKGGKIMARSEAANRAQYKYNDKMIKRVPLDMQKNYYNNELLPAAARAGVPVNTYIKQAIAEKIARDSSI